MKSLLGFALFLMASVCQATGWSFSPKVALSDAPKSGVFHHLEGAGRKHIAVSGDQLAVVWEDNSSGAPQIYLAQKSTSQHRFGKAIRVSNGQEAYEPAIAPISGARFVVVYEQDATVYARLLTRQGVSDALLLSDSVAAHPSVAAYGDDMMAVWREKQQHRYALKVARLKVENLAALKQVVSYQVEPELVDTPLLMPSITINQSTACIAWEDRRAGHTRLMYSVSDLDDINFSTPTYLNEFYSNRNEYDKGNGVTRVSIAGFGDGEVLAAWMDKRVGGKGYGIYAALGSDGGADFGPNEKVHSKQGDELPHYNPSVAGNGAGNFVVAWDDFRQGDSDIWLSFYNEDSEWSSDFFAVPASGRGEQTHASVALDDEGGLHLLWIERADSNSPSQLWYSTGKSQ
jgi:hypothetical protein